ncbi:MAG TPA: hypothetical protein GYA07_14915 [Verrucomicrobia bacterium]|nr:hypothetical protein [Verrucomicrobiota bacterium]HOP96219.1 hypothetical protein [Verrucomicrobiota bacterium]
MWNDDDTQPGYPVDEDPVVGADEPMPVFPPEFCPAESVERPEPRWDHGWPIPSTISANPDEARACIQLPEFDELSLEKARVISGRFPLAEAEYRAQRNKDAGQGHLEIPHFERVFRIAARMASVHDVENAIDYDEILILTAWHCVRPGVPGYLGSYPKSLLCPLSHAAPPVALNGLTPARRLIFDRRAPYYLRYLLCHRFGLRTCADIENADLRQLLRSVGFRLIRASAVPEIAFPGITMGEDPPVRPWKLTLRQELSDERAAEMLINAALWQIRYGLRLVTIENGDPRWNIGAFARTDWEDAFLSLGVRVPPSLTRESGLLDWRAVLARCLAIIGTGNLPADVLGKVAAVPQRVCHDSHQAIWEVLDRVAATVLEQVRTSEPHLFTEDGELNYEVARSFRRWARLFDEVSPQILSRFGVSAFTALHRVAPEYFGWGCTQLKPWELEQEHGKWKGPRGRALLRSAYAFALYETGLGTIETREEQVVWQCTTAQFSEWSASVAEQGYSAYDFLYALASRHGLTPLLSREVTHTEAVSLLAGVNVHENLPRIEGCWDLCMLTALEQHGGKLEVRLVVPDLVPLPLRLRKAVLAPLTYSYLHKELRLVRDFDLRMARESHRSLEEIPGWWEDERILGTPLLDRVNNPADPARRILESLDSDPWLEAPAQRIRFRAFQLLLSRQATTRTTPGDGGLTSEEIRTLLRLALETMEYTNIVQVSYPAIRRGFERILAREDTREMLDSLLLHIGTAYETEIWGQVRKFIVLDVINDLLTLTIRCSLLHLMSAD